MIPVTQTALGLAKPYWTDPAQRRIAWGLALAIIVLAVAFTGLNLWLTEINKAFYDALQTLNAAAFYSAVTLFFGAVAILVTVATAAQYLEQALDIRWRRHLTENLVGRWLDGDTFYRIERDSLCDNPDQRLTEDIAEYVRLMLSLTKGFIVNLGSLGTMGWVLWQSAGPMSFDIGGSTLTIPGYLFWLAVFWGVLQTLVTHLAGHRLAGLTVAQQSFEADYRFALAKVREASEQIALYRGQAVEQRRLNGLFGEIVRNWQQIMRQNIYLGVATTSFSVIAVLVPIIAVSPKVLSGELSLGTLMQDISAFAATTAAVAWFALSYRDLFQLSARTRRLEAMRRAMAPPPPPGIRVQRDPATDDVAGRQVALALPDGRPLSRVGEFLFEPGARWMVRGPSGVGKSTLLRAIAGLWPFGGGEVCLPAGARVMFMPQKSYLGDGTLRDTLTYPAEPGSADDTSLAQLLRDCRLPHLADRLNETARWGHRLSPGEQQRLAFARALLYRPDILFMDESSSALDNDTEAHLYQMVIDRLPDCTVVSVAHRTTLEVFHPNTLHVTAPA
ncbi:ABC transporter ATP-binding protein/permease [Zoogloea sp.]|uniref:ABC transporter ATP-binding protein/permease n=1 Tax=Zoogloea sp. TaxID=49181 RepID=UPI001AC5FE5D|nr:ABC transporter ATP-binding protein/permease [Zoogloea sp.]MBN8284360.1 ABC transporter ATP-binding protein/permease [Zoogloea sp.]